MLHDAAFIARFWAKVDRRGPDECWPWTVGTFRRRGEVGYGAFTNKPKTLKAHRVAYALECGRIPDGMMVLHACDNPPCCNPAHLSLGTHRDNMADMATRGRAAKGASNHFGQVKYRGDDSPRARLTAQAVQEIRTSKAKQVDLARKFGVSKQAINHVLSGRCWLHVP